MLEGEKWSLQVIFSLLTHILYNEYPSLPKTCTKRNIERYAKLWLIAVSTFFLIPVIDSILWAQYSESHGYYLSEVLFSLLSCLESLLSRLIYLVTNVQVNDFTARMSETSRKQLSRGWRVLARKWVVLRWILYRTKTFWFISEAVKIRFLLWRWTPMCLIN